MFSRLFVVFLVMAVPAGYAAPQVLPYPEFQKVISIRSQLIPINGQDESILLGLLPGDKYTNAYLLTHKNKKFTKLHDAGKSLTGLFADYARENYYFLMDNNGDENHQIYRFDLKTKKVDKVFGHDGFKASPTGFSRDGKRLYIRSNHKNKSVYSVYVLDLATSDLTALTDGKTSFDGAIISPQEKHAYFVEAKGNNELSLSYMNLTDKKLTKVLDTKATIYAPAFFSKNEKTLYLDTDQDWDRQYCARIPVGKKPAVAVVKKAEDRDINCNYDDRVDLSFVSESFDGSTELHIYKGIVGEEIKIPFPEKTLVLGFSPILGTTKAVARVLSASSPGDYYSFDWSLGKKAKLERITQLNQSKIKANEFARSYDINYKSFDGKDIHGIIYAKEDWIKGKKRYPLILWPHGGPDSFASHTYSSIFQYWALNGYVVFAPNFRGSTGYGKKFETLNDRDWGGGHIKDLIYGKNAVAKLNYVDPTRLYIVGASFGGFSTLSAITQFPTEFKGAVAIVAIGNLFTFFKSIPPDPAWQAEFRTEMGDPVKDKALYEERSPYFYAQNIRIPLKIYQAENDVRTVKAEMDNFVAKMKESMLPVEYEVLEKEGHSISRSENAQKVFEGTIRFLNSLSEKDRS